jgi:hypothetical protein
MSGSQGLNVIHHDTQGTYTVMADIPTNGGKPSTYLPTISGARNLTTGLR